MLVAPSDLCAESAIPRARPVSDSGPLPDWCDFWCSPKNSPVVSEISGLFAGRSLAASNHHSLAVPLEVLAAMQAAQPLQNEQHAQCFVDFPANLCFAFLRQQDVHVHCQALQQTWFVASQAQLEASPPLVSCCLQHPGNWLYSQKLLVPLWPWVAQ